MAASENSFMDANNYVNRELAEGNVAYGQIFVGNTPSRQLQEKLGMDFSDKFICWCGKSE